MAAGVGGLGELGREGQEQEMTLDEAKSSPGCWPQRLCLLSPPGGAHIGSSSPLAMLGLPAAGVPGALFRTGGHALTCLQTRGDGSCRTPVASAPVIGAGVMRRQRGWGSLMGGPPTLISGGWQRGPGVDKHSSTSSVLVYLLKQSDFSWKCFPDPP